MNCINPIGILSKIDFNNYPKQLDKGLIISHLAKKPIGLIDFFVQQNY
jgi:hypothetical protein